MKYDLLFLATVFSLQGLAQKNIVTQDSMIKKWEIATINIEAKTSLFMEPSISANFQKKLDKSNLTQGEKDQQLINLTRNKVGSSGTAIFLEYEHIHFLLTARHVLEDSNFPQAGFPYNQLFFPENSNIQFSPCNIRRFLRSLSSFFKYLILLFPMDKIQGGWMVSTYFFSKGKHKQTSCVVRLEISGLRKRQTFE